jgi:hypothetical protein
VGGDHGVERNQTLGNSAASVVGVDHWQNGIDPSMNFVHGNHQLPRNLARRQTCRAQRHDSLIKLGVAFRR